MLACVTHKKARAWLDEYLHRRSDFGLANLLRNLVLDPPNPFQLEVRRKPRAGFLVAAILFAAALAWFACFNLAP